MVNILNRREYIENFLKINTKKGELVPFKLNPPQQRLYNTVAELQRAGKPVRIIILKARQMGFSTITGGMIFATTATTEHCTSMIVAHQNDATATIFKMYKRFFDNLPPAIKPMTEASNAQELVFNKPSKGGRKNSKGLDSRIKCATAGGQGIGRSNTIRNLHLSEYAFWPGDPEDTFLGLAQAVPYDPGTMVIIESTANGYNAFKRRWDMAVRAQREGTDGFTPVFFAWYEMPEYRIEPPPGFEPTEEEQQLAELYGLDNEQLAWRRWCIANNCGGDLDTFKQEYPACPDEAFLATGRCAFDQETLIRRREEVRDEKWEYGEFRFDLNTAEKITDYRWEPDKKGPIRILKHPEEGAPYVIGGDTAGTGSDYFAAHVIDNRTGEQVAVLHQQFDERAFARQVYCLGMYYNEALVAIETNYSTYPQLALEDLGYTNFYVREVVDKYTKELTKSFGFNTNTKTRPLIIDELKDVVKYNAEMLTDFETMGEMLTFVYDENYKPQAEEGEHDDLVMSLAIAHHARPQQRYNSITPSGRAAKTEWTADMWQDYRNASPRAREELLKMWGEPKERR